MDEAEAQAIPRYEPHEGTIKVAGGTLPKGAGRCAFHYLQKQMFPIDFMAIGANANQQATKAMGIFAYMVKNSPEFTGMGVAFEPLLFKTDTEDRQTHEHKDKSVTIWRTVVFESKTKK